MTMRRAGLSLLPSVNPAPIPRRLAPGFALLLMLAACQPSEAVPPAATRTDGGAHTAAGTLVQDCGTARMTIEPAPAPSGAGGAPRTRLRLAGTGTPLDAPARLSAYSPVGLGCARDPAGVSYVVVEFGELPTGCAECEWFVLYDTEGRALDEGGTTTTRPDNGAYARALASRSLAHPPITYVTR